MKSTCQLYFPIFFTISLFFIGSNSFAQQDPCGALPVSATLDVNNIKANLSSSGTLFFDGEDGSYNIVSEENTPTTIFAQGLWIGGQDPGGNLKLAAQTYGLSTHNYDYQPGPIVMTDPDNPGPNICYDWNRIWSVYRYQIEAHLADFADNGVIDNPIDAIISWPGVGNPSFEEATGFSLPELPTSLAPFWDENLNGIYEPLLGDYPFIYQSQDFPAQITWMVFNDEGEHTASGGALSLQVEVQLTSWAYNCNDNENLNNATFHSYKIINKSIERLDSVYIGLWHDFDLGCYEDDYMGSHPESNTFFAYNQDNLDNACSGGIAHFGENPPVQAVTFLNRDLSKFIYYGNGGIVPSPPPATTDPQTVLEYYNYLSGRFRDGTPITEGGTGYNPGSTDVVNHIFSGNPNNLEEWSEYAQNNPIGDRRGIGSVFIEQILPGQVEEVDVMYSYFREEGATNIQNVETMYEGVAELQSIYDAQFAGACTISLICEDDCIWAGDLNADGIANHCDLLGLGAGVEDSESGATRTIPYNWTPQTGDAWANDQPNGANTKHLDANGSGNLDADDFLLTIDHYNLTHDNYQATDVYLESEEVLFEPASSGGFDELGAGEIKFGRLNLTTDQTDLVGIALSIEYDPVFVKSISFSGNSFSSSDNLLKYIREEDGEQQMDYALYHFESEGLLETGTLEALALRTQPNLPTQASSNTSEVRIKNIKGILADGTTIEMGSQTTILTFPDIMVATEEPVWAADLTIFPNPFLEKVTIAQGQNHRATRLVLSDVLGQQLLSQELREAQTTIDFSQLNLPSGVYFFEFIRGTETVTRKLVKQ